MFYVIINPTARSGKGMQIWQGLKKEMDERQVNYRYYFTRKDRSAAGIIKCILNKDHGIINLILMGGDGTVNQTINGIAAAGQKCFDRVRFCYIPAGSASDLARALQLPDDPHKSLRRILAAGDGQMSWMNGSGAAKERLTDLGLLTYNEAENPEYNGRKRYFIVSAGIGFDAAVCAEVANSKAKKDFNAIGLGGLVYGFICVRRLLTGTKADIRVIMDGKRIHPARDCLFVAVMNHRYQGGGVMFTPAAVSDDGLLDLCFTDRMKRRKILLTFPKAYTGDHVGTKGLVIDRARDVRIVSSEMLCVHTDGEVATRAKDISIRFIPVKLRLMV